MGKFYIGRGGEIEPHMDEAFRLSPRDMFAFAAAADETRHRATR